MDRGLKRGPKPQKIIDDTWRPELAYVIGLIASDGYLAKDGLLVDLTSRDREQLENYSKCLGIKFKIGEKKVNHGMKYLRIQIKNRMFYDFLLSVGLINKKSLTLSELSIPKKYFFDFLRGFFDGDGSSYSYWDRRWKSSFMFYVSFTSASKDFINWIRREIEDRLNIKGHLTHSNTKNYCYQIKYAKYEGVKLVEAMYTDKRCVCLSRKKLKINESLGIMGLPLI